MNARKTLNFSGNGINILNLRNPVRISRVQSVRIKRYNQSYNELQGDKLYVGEFERGRKYQTDDTHKGETPAGDYNTAFVYTLNFSGNGINILNLRNPVRISRVQSVRINAVQTRQVAFVRHIGGGTKATRVTFIAQRRRTSLLTIK